MNGGRTEEGYSSGLPNKVFFNKSLSRFDEGQRKLFLRLLRLQKTFKRKCVIEPYNFTVSATRFRMLYCFPSSVVCFSEKVSLVFSENIHLISAKSVARLAFTIEFAQLRLRIADLRKTIF